ncbi:uncharacterized protein LOC109836535 isoform X1 [Asparagus officinalis]|uniref:uncharacterized protein LOC109836535 isoform X1 n=1 Tax=Asparagus officinalis TaxID=4686 RepID=UPI00098E84B0|nr:uncharacterized protein LOC109836535 isoform X1 [Asparagus officinalis]
MKCEEMKGAEGENRDGESSLQGRRDVLGEGDLGLDRVVDNGNDSSSGYESGEVRDDDDDDLMEGGFFEVDSKNGDGLLEAYGDAEEPSRLCSVAVQRSGDVDRDGGSSCTVDLSQAMSEGCLGSDGDAKMGLGDDLEVKSLDRRSEGRLEMDVSDDSKGKGLCEKSEGSMDMDISEDSDGNGLCEGLGVAESCFISKDSDDLLKINNLTSVTFKPRTSVHRTSSKIDQIFPNEPTKVGEIVSELPKLKAEDDIRTNTSKGKESPVSSIMPVQHMEEPVEQKFELVQNPGLFRSSVEKDNANEVIWLLRQPLKPEVEKLPIDEEVVKGHVADQEKPVHNDSSQKFEPQLNIKTQAEEQLQTPVYKVCDLNLLPPEMIESEDDPVLDQFYTSMPVSEARRNPSVGLGCMMGNMENKTTIHSWISDDKMIPMVDLEDDSSIVYDAFGSLKPMKEPKYLSMAHVTENKDLHVAYNGCSLETSEFHRTDVLCLPPSSDLDNPHT